jgi:hypothetical protein
MYYFPSHELSIIELCYKGIADLCIFLKYCMVRCPIFHRRGSGTFLLPPSHCLPDSRVIIRSLFPQKLQRFEGSAVGLRVGA